MGWVLSLYVCIYHVITCSICHVNKETLNLNLNLDYKISKTLYNVAPNVAISSVYYSDSL
jgi:hypothetical protein